MSDNMHTRVTMMDVADLALVLRAAQGNLPVARLIDDARFDGLARRICDHAGGSPVGTGADMRDLYLEVALDGTGGAITRWNIGELLPDIRSGHAVMDAHKPRRDHA